MSIKAILAAIAGVFLAIVLIIGFAVVGTEQGPVAISEPSADVVADRQAPSLRNNPMNPVTSDEAARRVELHDRVHRERGEFAAATMAPPVVTEIRSGLDRDDAIARELFGDLAITPEPAEPEPVEIVAVPEPEPEPEPVAEIVEEQPVAPRFNAADFRDRFRVDTGRRGGSFGVIRLNDGIEGSLQFDSSLLPALIGEDAFRSMRLAQREAAPQNYVRLAQLKGKMTDALSDPIVVPMRPNVFFDDFPQGPAGYSAPRDHERSAARPAMVGVDQFGRAFTTSDQPNPSLAPMTGAIVLARGGDIITASLLYGFNSDDVRGLPIYATLHDFLPTGANGPLNGARIQGQVAYSRNNAAIIFDRMTLANGREMNISAIAVANSDARPGVASRVNNHTLSRYGSLFLSGLLQGVGEVAQLRLAPPRDDQPVIIINEGDGPVTVNDRNREPTRNEIIAGAVAPIGRNLSSAAAQGFNRPPTISSPAGMPFAVVFLDSLVFDPADDVRAFNPRTGRVEIVGTQRRGNVQPVAQEPAQNMTIGSEVFQPSAGAGEDAVWDALDGGSRR